MFPGNDSGFTNREAVHLLLICCFRLEMVVELHFSAELIFQRRDLNRNSIVQELMKTMR